MAAAQLSSARIQGYGRRAHADADLPKFKLTVEEQRELLSDYLPYCTPVAMPAKPPRTPPCRDAFDVPFLQLAIVGNADYLVTGDRDLLSLKGRISCPIVTAEELLRSFDRP